MTTIGERIVFMREEREMSQKELAEKLHITAATLSRYENNIHEPKVEILQDMCTILRTTSDFLLGFTQSFEIPGTGNTPQVTPFEYRMVKYYRKLNPTNQARIIERMETLYELQNKAESKSYS